MISPQLPVWPLQLCSPTPLYELMLRETLPKHGTARSGAEAAAFPPGPVRVSLLVRPLGAPRLQSCCWRSQGREPPPPQCSGVGADPAWCRGGFQCTPGASACLSLCT